MSRRDATLGTLGDRIGRRRLLMIGGAAFEVLSVVAAFADSPLMLIVARALLGRRRDSTAEVNWAVWSMIRAA
jgi:predicted MFS family arabinose efflux permease